METLDSFKDPSKNMFVEPANVSDDIQNLVRLTPGPINAHPPLAYALSKSPDFGPAFVERCSSGYKRSEGMVDDFVTTFAKHSTDDYKPPSSWTEAQFALFLIVLRFVFSGPFKPPFKSFIIHWCDLFYLNWNWAKSSGWPYCCDKFTRSKGQAWNKFTQFGRNIIHGIKHMVGNPRTCILPLKHYLIMGYNRFHLTKIDAFAKIRLVFGIPMIVLACEMQLFAGYLFLLKFYHSSPIAYGREIYNGGMVYINNNIAEGDIIICDDISGFDYHVPFWIMELIMRIILRNFVSFTRYWPSFKENGKYFHTLMDPILKFAQYMNVLTILFRWISKLKVLLPTKELLSRRFAYLPSGLYLTNFLDSCINTIITYHVVLCLGFKISDIAFLIVMGDDILFTITRDALNRAKISANEFYRRFDSLRYDLYNMTSRGIPKYVGTDRNRLVFLKYRNLNGRPIRNLEELTAGALSRERHLKPEYLASVVVGLAYAAVGTSRAYHTCLEDAYQFCIRAGLDKGIKQTVNPDDRFLEMLKVDLDFTDADLLRFPTYDEVLDRATSFKTTDGQGTYHNFNPEAFVYPNTAYSYLFEPVSHEIDIDEEFINSIPATITTI